MLTCSFLNYFSKHKPKLESKHLNPHSWIFRFKQVIYNYELPNLISNVKLWYSLSLHFQGERSLIYPRTIQSIVLQTPTSIHRAVERSFIFPVQDGASPVKWFKCIYHVTKEEFWSQTNWEERLKERPSTLIVAGLQQLGVLLDGLELSTKTAITDLARGCGSPEAAWERGNDGCSRCFLQTGGIIIKYSCCHRPQRQVSGGS